MAYGRTFLQVVNDVLRELREPTVSTWNENTYSTMIGQFVNSIKRTAEDAHRWTALTDWHAFSTIVGEDTYALTSTDGRAQVLEAWNATGGWKLRQQTWQGRAAEDYSLNGAASGKVSMWMPKGLDTSTGEFQVCLYPVPSAIEAMRFRVYAPQADMAADATVMLVPYRPVVEGAVARARNERGEDGGTSFADQAQFMARALADSIALDASQHSEDTVWEAV